jgi:hypothetical protein
MGCDPIPPVIDITTNIPRHIVSIDLFDTTLTGRDFLGGMTRILIPIQSRWRETESWVVILRQVHTTLHVFAPPVGRRSRSHVRPLHDALVTSECKIADRRWLKLPCFHSTPKNGRPPSAGAGACLPAPGSGNTGRRSHTRATGPSRPPPSAPTEHRCPSQPTASVSEWRVEKQSPKVPWLAVVLWQVISNLIKILCHTTANK